MYCSESPSMYCQRSLGSKLRVSLDFSQPATAPDAGNGVALFFLQPETAPIKSKAMDAAPNSRMNLFMEVVLALSLTSLQQNLINRGAAFTDAGHVNSWFVL